MVVGLAGAMAVGHDNATRFSFDGGNRAAEANTVPKRIGQFLDVVSAAALDGSPDRAVILQEAMIAEKRHEILSRKVQHVVGWRGPDRSAHRGEIVGQESRCEFPLAKI